MTRRRPPWEGDDPPIKKVFDEKGPTTPMEYAVRYAGLGWGVFPVHGITDEGICTCGDEHCSSPGKHPVPRHGHLEASKDPERIVRWNWKGRNVGVATGRVSGIWVLDVDAKDRGEKTLDDLVMINGTPQGGGALVRTPMALTGGGGQHYVFWHPMDWPIKTGVKTLGPGLDVRGEGGYIVVEPSRHVSMNQYYWEASSNPLEGQELVRAPLWLELMVRDEHPDRDASTETQADQPPASIDMGEETRLVSALKSLDPDAYETWVRVGMALYEMGNGSQQLFEYWDKWSQGSEKYRAHEMSRKWRSFRTGRSDAVTEDTLWYMAREAGWEDPQQATGSITLRVKQGLGQIVRNLLAKPKPDFARIELWKGSVLSRGNLTLIAGPPKIGKSVLIQSLLGAAAYGGEVFGHSFPQPLKVQWFQAEIREEYLHQRFARAIANLEATQREMVSDNYWVSDRLDLEITKRPHYDAIANEINEFGPDIVVFDPIINFSDGQELDPSKVKRTLATARSFGDLGNKPAVMLVHHVVKTRDDKFPPDPFTLIRGSTVYRGFYDSGIMMVRPKPDWPITLYYETRYQEQPEAHGVEYDFGAGVWSVVDLPLAKDKQGRVTAIPSLEADLDARRVAVLNELASCPAEGMTYTDLVAFVSKTFRLSDERSKRILKDIGLREMPEVNTRRVGRFAFYYLATRSWEFDIAHKLSPPDEVPDD